MKLGILVNTDSHLAHVVGLANAAVRQGHGVFIFAMDEGTKLLEQEDFRKLSGLDGVEVSFCDHGACLLGVNKEGLPEKIICGSQYNNAVMCQDSDRVIVL